MPVTIAITAETLCGHFGETYTDTDTAAKWDQIRAVAAALVSAEVGDPETPPPAAVLDEATIRLAGHLARDREAARLLREVMASTPTDALGSRNEYLSPGDSMRFMRASGCRALLFPWKRRTL